MSMCRVFACVVGRGCLLWPVHFLGKTLLVFALLPSAFQGQICLLLQVFLDFLLFYSNLLQWKGHLFLVIVLEGLEAFIEPFNFCFFRIGAWSIDLDYCDFEWFPWKWTKGEMLYTQQRARLGADCGSDHQLLIMKFIVKLKKVRKTTRPFRIWPKSNPFWLYSGSEK